MAYEEHNIHIGTTQVTRSKKEKRRFPTYFVCSVDAKRSLNLVCGFCFYPVD